MYVCEEREREKSNLAAKMINRREVYSLYSFQLSCSFEFFSLSKKKIR